LRVLTHFNQLRVEGALIDILLSCLTELICLDHGLLLLPQLLLLDGKATRREKILEVKLILSDVGTAVLDGREDLVGC